MYCVKKSLVHDGTISAASVDSFSQSIEEIIEVIGEEVEVDSLADDDSSCECEMKYSELDLLEDIKVNILKAA